MAVAPEEICHCAVFDAAAADQLATDLDLRFHSVSGHGDSSKSDKATRIDRFSKIDRFSQVD